MGLIRLSRKEITTTTPGCSESLWTFPNYNMKNSTIICLLLTALAVLMIAERAEGERFCGKRLAQFVSTTCHLNGKVNLKGRKGKLIIMKFLKYIPDMTISEKRHLFNMFSNMMKLGRSTRSVSHMPTWLKELESATELSEAESASLNQLIQKENHRSSPKLQPLVEARHRRGASIVDHCCNSECDINEVRQLYCAAMR